MTSTAASPPVGTSAAPHHRDRITTTGIVLAGVSVLACIAGVVMMLLAGVGPGEMYRQWFFHNLIVSLPLTAAFVVLVQRVPQNPVTWIVGISGVGGALLQVLPIAVDTLLTSRTDPVVHGDLSTLHVWTSWIATWSWVPVVFVLPTLLLLRFPDGRLPSPRWRWVERTAFAGLAVVASTFALGFLPPAVDPTTPMSSLEAEEIPVAVAETILVVGFPILLLSVVLSTASVVVRSRHADADTRRQIRWVGSGLVLLGLAALSFLGGGSGQSVFQAASLVVVPLIAASFPIAILKYRLYDIDVVITRAVTFGAMAAFVAGLYVVVVVGVGSLLGVGSDLSLSVLATLAVAVAFEPARAATHRWAARLVYGERATPYDTIQQLSARPAHEAADDVERLAGAVARGTGADQVVVWLSVRGELVPGAVHGDRLDDDGPRDRVDRLPGELVQPVVDADVVLGALTVTKPAAEPVVPGDRRLLADVAAAAVPLLTNVRLRAELRRRADELRTSRRRVLATQDRARRALERDLHDGAQQELVALRVKLGLARTLADRAGDDVLCSELEQLSATTQEAIDAMRVVARGIYPPLLESEGLNAALVSAAHLVGTDARVTVQLPSRPPREQESSLYFCALEVMRAMQHAGVDGLAVEVSRTSGGLLLDVVGGGEATGLALPDVVDRVAALDGTVTIAPGGDHVEVWLPHDGEAVVAHEEPDTHERSGTRPVAVTP